MLKKYTFFTFISISVHCLSFLYYRQNFYWIDLIPSLQNVVC